MVYRGLWQYLPEAARNLIGYTPLYAYRRLRNLNEMFKGIGRSLYQSNAADGFTARVGKRDVMSVLCEYLSYDELIIETLIGFRSTQPEIK